MRLQVTAILVSLLLLGHGAAQEQESEHFRIQIGVILPSGAGDDAGALIDIAARDAAMQGIEMATDELGFNAQVLGFELAVSVEEADGPEAAGEAAAQLVDDGALALAGGYGQQSALAISQVAQEAGVPFLNIGSPSVALRNEQCSATMFHIEPGGGMYLDAMAGWFVGAGFRDWYLIGDDSVESAALEERFRWALNERHFGARVSGESMVGPDAAEDEVEAALQEASEADVVLLLLPGERQVELLARADQLGMEVEITGFPWPETQTREYYELVLEAAPETGAGFRATAWEPTLDAYGARELNARFQNRFGEAMDAPAWASYQAVKLVFEAASFGGVRDRAALQEHFTSQGAVFDIWKGIGVTFRPWNHQLRQTLYLVELVPGAPDLRETALLVGELPEIYMPRTDPVERLDQLGDSQRASGCEL